MRAVGFRAATNELFWAVVEGTIDEPVLIDSGRIKRPRTMPTDGDALAWFVGEIGRLVREYQPQRSAVRTPEPVGRAAHKMFPRVRLEGAVIATLVGHQVPCFSAALGTITAELGATTSAKRYIDGGHVRGVDISEMLVPQREAVVVAVAALDAA